VCVFKTGSTWGGNPQKQEALDKKEGKLWRKTGKKKKGERKRVMRGTKEMVPGKECPPWFCWSKKPQLKLGKKERGEGGWTKRR